MTTTTVITQRVERLLGEVFRDLVPAVPASPRIGVDAVDIDALRHEMSIAGDRLVARLFTPAERTFCNTDYDRFATTLAGKEAVAKALGTGLRGGVSWQQIEILREPTGRPYVQLTDGARARAEELRLRSIAISLCHEGLLALAVAFGVPEGGVGNER